jgi:uncharacterized protein (TIGR03086 family)
MALLDLYRQSVTAFADRVARIRPDQWTGPTPCRDWDVRTLVNHVVYEQRWSVPLFAGATIAEVGDQFEGDLLGDDPQGAAAAAAEAAQAAVQEPGVLDRTVHLSFGETPATEYLYQLFADHLIHGWDLAVGTGQDRTLDPEALRAVAEWFASNEEGYRSSGAIGPRIDLPDDASAQDRLLAAFGRDPNQAA